MPDPVLQATALRYAAGDLTPEVADAFESRLALDQDARDALSEAVRLSARAVGQCPPAPHPASRQAVRARLALRDYRGHPFTWAGLGAAAVAAGLLAALSLGGRNDPGEARAADARQEEVSLEPGAVVLAAVAQPPDAAAESAAEPADDPRSVAEIWADMSNHEGVEKARDDELRWRNRFRDLGGLPHAPEPVRATADEPQP